MKNKLNSRLKRIGIILVAMIFMFIPFLGTGCNGNNNNCICNSCAINCDCGYDDCSPTDDDTTTPPHSPNCNCHNCIIISPTPCSPNCDCDTCNPTGGVTPCTPNCNCNICQPIVSPTPSNEIALSHAPGFFNSEFYLSVSIAAFPNARIYFTLDGTDPSPTNTNIVVRPNRTMIMAGEVMDNIIRVEDRTAHKADTHLTQYYTTWARKAHQGPAADANILMGNAFRFRAFYNGVAVSPVSVATFIVTPNATERFSNTPVISINANYSDFFDIYYLVDRWNVPPNDVRRRDFNFEYFTVGDGTNYQRRFNARGSTSIGGSWTRDNAQRTLNVHMQRGTLNYSVTYPIFENLNEFYRFRLWNGGNNFIGPRNWFMGSDSFRDAFSQKAASGLSVPYSDSSLAIKFVNGEFWGFTQFREHTSNASFVHQRTGINRNNVALIDRTAIESSPTVYIDEVADGNETVVTNLYNQLVNFITSNFYAGSVPSDALVAELFDHFFCQTNFMDYIIANTFLNNSDWPQNNVRFFRAITPVNNGNPNNDGRWRFILHDMDQSANGVLGGDGYWRANDASGNRFGALLNPNIAGYPIGSGGGPAFNWIFRIFANQNFVNDFTLRAEYALQNHFTASQLITLYNNFYNRFLPLLDDMYERFAIDSRQDTSEAIATTRASFDRSTQNVRFFLNNRQNIYLSQLNDLRNAVGLSWL